MSRFIEIAFASAAILASGAAAAQVKYPGVGRAATPAEIKAWDIDVRPDFKGLPAGSGSVSKGQQVWEAKCASCHGTFGESNEVFTPIAGGTTQEDIKAGRAKKLLDADVQRTTLMKLSSISTLWDYINRAMPWNAPKSLTVEEVYAVTAYTLNLGGILPDDFVLSDRNMRDVQALLPNRNGMTRNHGLWDIRGKPDVKNAACMKHCPTESKIVSELPDHARGHHGNLADQNRFVGPVRGQQTAPEKMAKADQAGSAPARGTRELADQSGCFSCHGVTNKIVGPAFTEIAAKYRGTDGAEAKLVAVVRNGGTGAWGQVAMPPQPQLKEDEIRKMVQWLLGGAK